MSARLLIASILVLSLSAGAWAVFGRDSRLNPDTLFAAEGNTALPAPEFTGLTDWINSKPLKLADQKGKVVVVHFWTNGCINCIHNYPHYRAWQDKFKDDKNLLIIGVHTPEFQAEKDVNRIKDRMAKNVSEVCFPAEILTRRVSGSLFHRPKLSFQIFLPYGFNDRHRSNSFSASSV